MKRENIVYRGFLYAKELYRKPTLKTLNFSDLPLRTEIRQGN